MGKKFIDKKKAATFCLLARDSSDPIYAEGPENDRVFIRVDNNPVTIRGLDDEEYEDDHEVDPNYMFADAPDDVDCSDQFRGQLGGVDQPGPLPDRVRREILELGFPDDGYNYLTHLREIRNTGAGSTFYENPKANLHDVPEDVKAYDASRVRVVEASEETIPKILCKVAEKSVNVRIQKAVDPDIAKLLEESDSEIGSDIDGLEEDFVVKANINEETGYDLSEESETEAVIESDPVISHGAYNNASNFMEGPSRTVPEKPRVERLLDQQFDILERQEYGSDSDEDYDAFITEDIPLAEKLNKALKDHGVDDLNIDENYQVPTEDIARRCAEYAERYENEDDDEVVIVEESSDESESDNFDCETIVSTYSNLDNHPGRINAPEIARRRRLAETISLGALKVGSGNVISLGGKDKLPVDYLPNGRKTTQEKEKPVTKTETLVRKSHGLESKEEKKERKSAVKEERREARRLKKELKGVYRGEATRAQKVVAVSGPSSIHLS